VVSPSQNISLVAGKRAELICKAEGSPKPDVQWQGRKKDRTIVMNPVTPKDNGVYTCHARNSVGEVWMNVTVTVECK